MIGDDQVSQSWLSGHTECLREYGAVGLLVIIETVQALNRLWGFAPSLLLSPVVGNDRAELAYPGRPQLAPGLRVVLHANDAVYYRPDEEVVTIVNRPGWGRFSCRLHRWGLLSACMVSVLGVCGR